MSDNNLTFGDIADKSNMRSHIESWPLQIQRSWRAGQEAVKQQALPQALIWAGMGGSAIGGDFYASLAGSGVQFPLLVYRGGKLPAWLNKSHRLLAVSYSGNTAETLATAREAHERGLEIDVLTSGGELARWARRNNIEPWLIEEGCPPRAALGDLFAFAYGAFYGRGWCNVTEGEVQETVSALHKVNEYCGVNRRKNDSLVTSLLSMFSNRLPMIYGAGNLIPVARRWACQINENAKLPSHWGELPEMNHNEVVAFIKRSPWASKCAIILLQDKNGSNNMERRVEATLQLAENNGWLAKIIKPTASSPMASMFELTAVGDWLSYWMAVERGTNPTPIEPINTLKSALERR